ncbi:MAG: L,D-transpeptidase family protein [Rhodospirillaceae bacterium]|nr:L,D-transpeptidase family protein [Rhodospirillaceae bacterium]
MRGRLGFRLRSAAVLVLAASVFGCATPMAPPPSLHADRILVEKSKRLMHLMQNGKSIKTYYVALGQEPAGAKRRRGDQRTPEGVYTIDFRRPESRFNKALHISYPNARDRQQAALHGLDPGGEIYIHGEPHGGVNPVRLAEGPDWTDGCIAVSNTQIAEIWRLVRDGTTIEIRP